MYFTFTLIMKKTLLLFIAILFYCNTNAQIVNIENARMHTDTTGLMGNAGANLMLAKNTTQVFAVNVDAHLQYKTSKNLYLLLGSYGFLKGTGARLTDNSFLHFRYNYKLNKILRWEAFTQVQKNRINKIEYRYLIGTGPRFKIVSTNIFKLYAATLIMYEQEKEIASSPIQHKDWRNSSYISLSLYANKNTELVTTSFYQPLLNNFTDYRILNQTKLKIKASKKLAISLNYNYLFDYFAPAGTPKTNYNFSTGLDYDF